VEHEWICVCSELGEYVLSSGFFRHVAKHSYDVSAVCRRSRETSRASLNSKTCLAPGNRPPRVVGQAQAARASTDVMSEHNNCFKESHHGLSGFNGCVLMHPDQPSNTQELQKLATRPAAHGPVSLLQAPNTKFVNTDVASSWTPRPEVIS
jgi:hypothetical protein